MSEIYVCRCGASYQSVNHTCNMLRRQLAEAREAICIYVREHMDTAGIENDDDAVIYFKNTFNEENYN